MKPLNEIKQLYLAVREIGEFDMPNIASNDIVKLFEDEYDILVVWKCDKTNGRTNYTDSVPLGFEALAKTTNDRLLFRNEGNRTEPLPKNKIEDLWFVKVQISCVPWGVADIVYNDIKGNTKKIGVSGEFDFEVKNTRGLVVDNFNEAKRVTAIEIKNKLLPKICPEVKMILSNHASKHDFDKIDKKQCADELMKRLSDLFRDTYSLELNRITIEEVVEN